MRRFGSERIVGLMERLGMEEDTPIEHRVISKSIEGAQTKVEGHNFDMRRHVVQYDDVMNRHREVIYTDRRAIVSGEDMTEKFEEMLAAEIEAIVDRSAGEKGGEIDDDAVVAAMTALIPNISLDEEELAGLDQEELTEALTTEALRAYEEVEARFGADVMRKVERQVMLAVMDRLWIEHLTAMDDLREGVGLQAYGQRDPLVVYKTEGYRMYQQLIDNIQHDVVHTMFRVQPAVAEQPIKTEMTKEVTTNRESENGASPVRTKKLRPNDRCYCGSGKKYKFCHGAPVAKSLV
jgi:preprotein translocase subunit SecA